MKEHRKLFDIITPRKEGVGMQINIINVTAAIDYIESNLADRLDLEIVADAVHYSKYHLHRVFTDTIGLTIHFWFVFFRQLEHQSTRLHDRAF